MGTESVFVHRKPSVQAGKKSLQGSIVIGTFARSRDYTECSLQSLQKVWRALSLNTMDL